MDGITRWIQTHVGNRFFSKVTLVMAAILCAALVAFGMISSSVLSSTLVEKELDYQWQALSSMARYLSSLELQFASLLYSVDDKRYTEIMQYLRTDAEDYSERQRVLSHLSAMLGASEDILDVILVRQADGRVVSRSRSRWILKDAITGAGWYRRIKENGEALTILPTHSPDYVRNSKEGVLTYAVNLTYAYGDHFRKDVGALIVNYRARSLNKAVDAYHHLSGNLMVLDRTGHVVFDRDAQYTGAVLPYFGELAPGEGQIDIGRSAHLTLLDKTSLNNYYLACVTPMAAVLSQAEAIQRMFAAAIVGLVAVSVLTMIASGRVLSRKVTRVSQAMAAFESGDFSHRIEVSGDDEVDALAKGFNRMSERLNQYIDEVYLLGAKQKSAELSALQSQINPHFLFNVLETIRMEAVQQNEETIAQMVTTLGKIFRMNLRDSHRIVPVAQEVEYLEYYLQLQKYRLGDRLEYQIEIEPELFGCGIPKFSLQPLVENAITHGIAEQRQGGTVQITGTALGGAAVFRVIDDGVGLSSERLAEVRAGLDAQHDLPTGRIGLYNVNDRIRLLFGAAYGLSIDCAEGRTSVQMTIPLTEGEAGV